MTAQQAKAFGAYVRNRRESFGISQTQLARLVETRDSTINRLEAGAISAPRPDKLTRIADYLNLDLADVFAMVGYAVPRQLPNCLPYLRAKFPELPQEAINEIEIHLRVVAQRHGVNIDQQEVKHDSAPTKGVRPTFKALNEAFGEDFA
jgi:transcriptional regulator with XRE-family HTH domain